MFSIYGVAGPLFRGPLEEFKRVSPTLGVPRTRRLDAVQDHLDAPVPPPPPYLQRGGGHARVQRARSAYERVQQPKVPERHPLNAVSDVMSSTLVTVADDLNLQQAWLNLVDAGVGQAPVLNAQGQLVGLLTRAELLRLDQLPTPDQAALVWRAWLFRPVSEVMLSPVPAVSLETDLRRVARVLLDTDLPGLPVVGDDHALVGFVSRSDLLKAVVNDPPLDLWS